MNDSSGESAAIPSALKAVLGRRSVSPRHLCLPGPSPADVELMLRAALRAPNHGALRPWRVIEFPLDQRAALADLFEQEKQRRDGMASAEDCRRAREHALRPPALLGFIAAPRRNARVPIREQWLGAGAALGNLLNAAHALGYGAIVLSGERCFDEELLQGLGVQADEALVGFVSIGSIREAPPAPVLPSTDIVRSVWRAPSPGRVAVWRGPPIDVESGSGA